MTKKSNLELAKEAITKLKEKEKADKKQTEKSIDAIQKRIQTKKVKRLMTTGGAYKKRAPVKVIDTKSSGSTYKFYAGGGKAIKGGGNAYGKNS